MCGLVGVFAFDGSAVSASNVERMAVIARHRGPDDQGLRMFSFRRDESIEKRDGLSGAFEGGVGFNRLAILDLSPNGHQPMVTPDGRVFITFNGEVYNAFDFTKELEARGCVFKSKSDTEVILYLYREFGVEEMLSRLNGMFAIVIVDMGRREIHIARDHVGIKPLYWMRVGETLVWGSEIKSLLAYPGASREADPAMLDEQFLFRYTAGEATPFRGVRQLRPGHRMVVTPGGMSVHRYWDIPDVDPKPMPVDRAIAQINDRLEEAVRRQLISDVKVGCQLSGGIDSSLVTAMARDRFGAKMESFSITFSEAHVSEEKWIRQAAEKTQTVCHTFPLTFEYFMENLDRAAWHMDYPPNLANSVGLYLLAQESRKHVTVLLSGDGADEVYGGYPRFFFAQTRGRVMPFMWLLERLPKIGGKFHRNYNLPPGLDFERWFVKYSASMRMLQLNEIRPQARLEDVLASRLQMFREGRSTLLHNCLKYESQTFMVELLIRQDKMMMAHSVENRVPMLDRDLVELSRTLPHEALVSSRMFAPAAVERGTKIALKKMAEKRFGERFAYRPKEGFGLPLMDYFRRKEFEEHFREVMMPSVRGRGWVEPKAVESWYHRVCAGDARVTEAFWTMVSVDAWARQFLDDRGQWS
jgi:asparagine synthase (glutamine-hydrolysing)